MLPNALQFAGLETIEIEIVDVHRHGAEKLHAMLKDFGDRDNSRVRDLVDIMLLAEHDLLSTPELAAAVTAVWAERDGTTPPAFFPALPASWPGPYERLATEHDVDPPSFTAAVARAADLWAKMFPSEET